MADKSILNALNDEFIEPYLDGDDDAALMGVRAAMTEIDRLREGLLRIAIATDDFNWGNWTECLEEVSRIVDQTLRPVSKL